MFEVYGVLVLKAKPFSCEIVRRGATSLVYIGTPRSATCRSSFWTNTVSSTPDSVCASAGWTGKSLGIVGDFLSYQITELHSLLPSPVISKSCCTPGLFFLWDNPPVAFQNKTWSSSGNTSIQGLLPGDRMDEAVSFPGTGEFGSGSGSSEAAQRHLDGAISNVQKLLSIGLFCSKPRCFLEYLSLLVLIKCCSIALETK